ncbi:hypothetical protein FGB62_352g02 [Gracilaria domingensis]|nr:hypothetical protein FGB62_352g02 [Gracilaria domingensis]
MIVFPQTKSKQFSCTKRRLNVSDLVNSMMNLGRILRYGTNTIPKDSHRAQYLFVQAVRQPNEPESIACSAEILSYGADLVEPDPKRAFGVCECVIKERNEKGATNCMAKLVSYAHKEITIDAKGADMLYQQLVDEENDEAAMVGTGELLWNGLEELSPDRRRAIERCARPIKEPESDGGPRSTSAVMHRLPDGDVPTDRTWAIKLCNESTDANQHVFGKLTLASFEVLVSV